MEEECSSEWEVEEEEGSYEESYIQSMDTKKFANVEELIKHVLTTESPKNRVRATRQLCLIFPYYTTPSGFWKLLYKELKKVAEEISKAEGTERSKIELQALIKTQNVEGFPLACDNDDYDDDATEPLSCRSMTSSFPSEVFVAKDFQMELKYQKIASLVAIIEEFLSLHAHSQLLISCRDIIVYRLTKLGKALFPKLLGSKMDRLLDRLKQVQSVQDFPAHARAVGVRISVSELLGLQTKEVANCLTYASWRVVSRLRPSLFIDCKYLTEAAAGKSDRDLQAWGRLCKNTRLVTALVAHSVIRARTSKRASALRFWISVAKECKAQGNHLDMCSIVRGLQTRAVARLTSAWKDLPGRDSSALAALAGMAALCSPENGFHAYKAATRNSEADFIPLFDALLHDLPLLNGLAQRKGGLRLAHEGLLRVLTAVARLPQLDYGHLPTPAEATRNVVAHHLTECRALGEEALLAASRRAVPDDDPDVPLAALLAVVEHGSRQLEVVGAMLRGGAQENDGTRAKVARRMREVAFHLTAAACAVEKTAAACAVEKKAALPPHTTTTTTT
mmetsp:Transcript_5489/g.13851  ORF Transcript_5489/g.13851 Transcript_5489/m.13851 type:complete len:563 (+) Transcript_5489:578-2266(+)|eukprot:CAMPEP_0177665082 /NCGR_PEP_ID=MMETSP0447-20121125/20857_1 /TAXON_ID=0 /ORGANISM="Stygamoeba regulata, Strain BSH-02190019" /LENGTH=562 /DNA_ID=CAMNT_0019171137 /DNA_START=209 /DNA_END=1897 /DNA_ORIENTATION=-